MVLWRHKFMVCGVVCRVNYYAGELGVRQDDAAHSCTIPSSTGPGSPQRSRVSSSSGSLMDSA